MTNNTLQITTDQFLDDLYGSVDANIFFNVNGRSWKDKPQTYSEAQSTLAWLNDDKNADIYFIPNSGGTRNSQITHINSVFIDWDAGKDCSGNYFPLEIVKQKKQECRKQLALFPYKPTYIIETRNGYHVYWLLSPGATTEQFVLVQKQLIAQFDSDPKIHNPARVMRLPGYYASKSGKYSPFRVNIIEHNDITYNIDSLLSHFHLSFSLSQDSDQDNTHLDLASEPTTQVACYAPNNTYIKKKKVYTTSIIGGAKRHFCGIAQSTLLNTMDEVVDYLCRQNIADYLGVDNHSSTSSPNSIALECPFHNDSTPSASIYYHKEYCFFKCHSSNCDFDSGTIIRVVEMMEGITEGDAVVKLMEYYNLQLDDTWKKEEKRKCIENIKVIGQCGSWKEQLPDLYRCINRVQEDLISKILFARDNTQLRTSQGRSLFFCSLRQFERTYRQNPDVDRKNRQNERIDRYCLLGLLEKIHEKEIPYGLYRNMEELRGKRRFQYRIQCYHLPEYTPELLKKADEVARITKERGIKLNSITKNSVRDVFGEDAARRLYPQTEDIEPSGAGAEFRKAIERVLLEEISARGYTTTSTVKERLCTGTTWKTVHDRRVKGHLPGLLEKHGFVEVTASKKLKDRYGIESTGYPRVILSKVDYDNIRDSSAQNGSDARSPVEIVAA